MMVSAIFFDEGSAKQKIRAQASNFRKKMLTPQKIIAIHSALSAVLQNINFLENVNGVERRHPKGMINVR